MSQTDKNFKIYRASAGSGKTYKIALKYIGELMKKPEIAHTQILAVTFTNDAAGEMKERILDELRGLMLENSQKNDDQKDFLANLQEEINLSEIEIQKKAKIAYEAILGDFGNFNVTTIDSFFQKILRNMAKELEINLLFDIEMDEKLPIRDAVKAVIDKSAMEKNKDVLEKIVRFVEHKLENEKWNIKRDLESFAKNIFKEIFQKQEKNLRGQTENIKKSIKDCYDIKRNFEEKMNKFIEEFNELWEKYEPQNDENLKSVGTINTYYKNISKKLYSDDDLLGSQGIKDAIDKKTEAFIKKVGKKDGILPDYFDEILLHLEKTNDFRLKHIENYNSACLFLKHIHSLQLLEDISLEIENQNKEQNRFMLAKTNQLLNEIIDDNDTPFIYEKIGANIKSVIIDEFQDTSALQWENFKPLIDKNNFGMLVGDVKQSIYRFRNGDWQILNNIGNDKDFVENPEDVDTLKNNFRSAINVVNFNNELFANISKEFGEDIQEAYREDSLKQTPKKKYDGFVSVDFVKFGKPDAKQNSYETEDGENLMVNKIAKKVRYLHRKDVKQKDICILCSTGNQISKIAEKLPKLLVDEIPDIKIISGTAFEFNSSKELQSIILALQVLDEPNNQIYKTELMLKSGKVTKDELNCEEINDKINKLTNELLENVDANLPLYDLIIKLCNEFGFNNKNNSGLSTDFLFAFLDKVLEFSSKNTSDIPTFLEYWDEKLNKEALPMPTKKGDKRDGILTMTIHKSKGLEFHSVIVPFVDWATSETSKTLIWCSEKDAPFDAKVIPVDYSKKAEKSVFKKEFDEETLAQNMDNLNVLYVALTRAGKNLLVLAKEPSKSGDTQTIQKLIYKYLQKDKNFDENIRLFQIGEIIKSDEDKKTDKKEPIKISFNMHENKQEVRTSVETEKIREGKIIHKIFENISVLSDVENAVKKVISLGEIKEEDGNKYVNKVKEYIENLGDKDWFSGIYKIFNEKGILDNKKVLRPDKVLLDENKNSATIIDYKTGEPSEKHKEQVVQYAKLMRKMGYEKTQGFIWYLDDNKIIEVKEDNPQ